MFFSLLLWTKTMCIRFFYHYLVFKSNRANNHFSPIKKENSPYHVMFESDSQEWIKPNKNQQMMVFLLSFLLLFLLTVDCCWLLLGENYCSRWSFKWFSFRKPKQQMQWQYGIWEVLVEYGSEQHSQQLITLL